MSASTLDHDRPVRDPVEAIAVSLCRPGRPGEVPAGVAGLTLHQLIAAITQAGAARNAQAVIALYQAWITRQPAESGGLFAAWFNLGCELAAAGNKEGAIAAYRQVLALRPGFHPAATNLGLQLEAAGHPDLALQTWAEATQSDAERTALLNNRARLLEQLGQLDEAEAEMRRSLLTDPAQPDVVQHWLHVRQRMCRWPILADEIPGLPAATLLQQAGPLAAMALTDDVALQREVGSRWVLRKTAPTPTRLSPPEGYRHPRVRLGYLSSDFCSHAMSYLIAELLERHDRNAFEVYGYCSSPEDGSAVRTRIIAAFDHFNVIRDQTDEQAALTIRRDEIDVLVDLNGLTAGARAQVLRWKPAPVQATYLGFVGPVPLPELDYLFCDAGVVPPAAEADYAPKPLRIAAVYQANDSKRVVGAPTTRAAVGLPDDRFVFCCFTNAYKITEGLFAAWMEILRRTDDSVLWLAQDNRWAMASMLAHAERCGIAPSRIIVTPRVGPAEYMARLPLGDLFLDTFPYNAGTVASDAIRMGLPLLTLPGRSFASRMAGQLLLGVGVTEGIAASLQDYVNIAVRLASDRAAYEAYRLRFSDAAWARGIGDTAAFTRDYEAALRGIVHGGHNASAAVS